MRATADTARGAMPALLLCAALAATPAPALALAFGELRAEARLGEHLMASIPLQATPQESADVIVRVVEVATAGQWLRSPAEIAGILSATIVVDSLGTARIRVHSATRLDEPYLGFTLEAFTGQQRIRHEFAVLADPPRRTATAPAPRRIASPDTTAGRQARTAGVPPAPTAMPKVTASSPPPQRTAVTTALASETLRQASAPAAPKRAEAAAPPEEPARIPRPIEPTLSPPASSLGKALTALALPAALTVIFVLGGILLLGPGATRKPQPRH